MCFPGGSDGKESAYNVGYLDLIPGLVRFPGEGNSTHFSILAWRIPWTEEPGRMQSMGSQKVGHDFSLCLTYIQSESESCSVMSDSVTPWIIQSMVFSRPNSGVGSLSLLQGIFPTQGLNPGLPHCRQILYQLSHKKSCEMPGR